MSTPLKLMAILAHPDDETLGCGGALARYAAEGVETHVLCATRGQSGRHGEGPHPGKEELGRIREAELREAAALLGVHEVTLLDYMDAHLDEVAVDDAVGRIVGQLRRVRPQVVITFDPDGAYGHPDHIAICQFTSAALVAAADPGYGGGPVHRVSKLYYIAWGPETWAAYQEAFKTLTSTVDGVVRQVSPWREWAITTRIDARPWWPVVWSAVQCHRTQTSIFGALELLPEERHASLWGDQTFYRAYSIVNGGRAVETDLFEGLREAPSEGADE